FSVMRMRSCTIVTPSTLAVFSESNEVCDTALHAALASCALAFCALTPGGATHTEQKIAACSKAQSRHHRGFRIIGPPKKNCPILYKSDVEERVKSGSVTAALRRVTAPT